MTVGRILANDRDKGSGFALATSPSSTTRVVLTAKHVVGDQEPSSLQFFTEDQRRIPVERVDRDNDLDIAVLYLREDVAGRLVAGRALEGKNWETETQPRPHDPKLYGTVIDIHRRFVKKDRGREIYVLQLSEEQNLGDYKGYSGSPVMLKSSTDVVIGVLIEELPSRLSMPTGQPRPSTNVLYAIPIQDVLDWLAGLGLDLRPSDQCPYRNLKAFTRDDASLFFGRQRVLDKLVKHLRDEPRFLAVLGPSGCGKSSLVQAGLLPRLEKEAVLGSHQWQIIITHPTDPAFTNITTSLQEKLHHVALFIDQFEELFTPAFSKEDCQKIVTLLMKLLEESPYAHLILTLRNDFYSHFVRFEALEQWLKKGIVNVTDTLQPQEVRDIIQEPAKIVHLGFDAGLVEIMVKDALEMHPSSDSKEAGSLNMVLPLLEAALSQLWERRDTDQGKLTLAAYRTIGGVTGGLRQWADKVYYEVLTERTRELADRIFTQLVYVNNDETLQFPYSRRRRQKDELIPTIASEQGMVEQALQQLITARLLVANQIGEHATIELSHEVLLREWPKLRDLLDETRGDILFQQPLSKDVAEWEQRKRERKQSRDLLYRGNKLKQAREWARRNRPSEQEVAFIQAGATQRTLRLVSLIVVVLLLISSAGVAIRFALAQPVDPTVVTTEPDGVSGSLRYCVDNAPTGSTIRFAQGMRGRTIKLTKGDLVLTSGKQLTIAGPGADQLTISGLGAIIHVFKGATLNISGLSFKNNETVNHAFLFNEGTLNVNNSTISGNKTTGADIGLGGGIDNRGTLNVNNSTISNNWVTGPVSQGGGIYNSGKFDLDHSTISNNEANGKARGGGFGAGGGIYNDSTGTLTVTNHSAILDNKTSSTSGIPVSAGGGIINLGTLTVANSIISNNLVTGSPVAKGGGIYSDGKLTVSQSSFLNNTTNSTGANGAGGGIINDEKGTLTVTNSTFSGNLANGKQAGQGGGIANVGMGKLMVIGSTFSNNTANGTNGGFGGGIGNSGTSTLLVTGSTFTGNSASSAGYGLGGGIQNIATLIVINSTFSNNSVQGKLAGLGGGIYFGGVKGASATIRFCTIYENISNTGGGILVDTAGTTHITISDSIIAANSARLSGPDISGPVISGGYNLIENTAGATGLNASVDRQVTLADLKIDTALGGNGGSTKTVALLPGSPAIDAVPLQLCSITITDLSGRDVTISTDQRGDPRPDGSENACDIGAYESS